MPQDERVNRGFDDLQGGLHTGTLVTSQWEHPGMEMTLLLLVANFADGLLTLFCSHASVPVSVRLWAVI